MSLFLKHSILLLLIVIFSSSKGEAIWGWFFHSKPSLNLCDSVFTSPAETDFFKLLDGDRKHFNTSRNFATYNFELSGKDLTRDSFENTLLNLKPGSIYFDSGSGETQAISQMIKLKKFNHISSFLALTYKYPTIDTYVTLAKKQGKSRFDFLHGKTLEDFYDSGRLNSYIGRIDFISDLYGPAEYSLDLRKVLSIYLKLLKTGGKIRLQFSTVRNRLVVNKADKFGAIDWMFYFKAISGAQSLKINEDPEGFNYVIELTKSEDHFELPELEHIDYRTEFRGQPHRTFYFADYTAAQH